MNQPRLFFLHIPKAGGTTFYDVLSHNIPYRDIAKIDGTYVGSSIKELCAMPSEKKLRIGCVAGHLSFGLHEDFTGPFMYITFLRKTVKRVISLYNQIRPVPNHPLHDKMHKSGMTLSDFVASDLTPEIDNDQVRRISGSTAKNLGSVDLERALSNLENYFPFVGLAEQYDLSLVLLGSIFPHWDMSYVRRNIGKKELIQDSAEYATIETVIHERNWLDDKLYEHVYEQFQRRVTALGVPVDEQLERLQESNRRRSRREQFYGVPLRFGRRLRNKLRLGGWWLR